MNWSWWSFVVGILAAYVLAVGYGLYWYWRMGKDIAK